MKTINTICKIEPVDLDTAFQFLTPEERQDMCPYLSIRECSASTVLIKGNEPCDCLGFVARGKIAVKKETKFAGKYIVLAILETGTVVGETEMLKSGPRSSTVVAVEDSRILNLTEAMLDQLLREKPELGIKILKRIIYILSLRLRKAGERLSDLL